MLLKDYPSRDCVHKVLDEAFLSRLETVKELMGKYASPDFRVAVDSDEREAIQRLNLQSAVLNVKHLYWLIERMVDLRVADNAVKLWSDQAALVTDLQKLLSDADMWRNMTPGLPVLVQHCCATMRENTAAMQWRRRTVDGGGPLDGEDEAHQKLASCPKRLPGHSSTYALPEIIELPRAGGGISSDHLHFRAQELLKQCLGFSTRNVDDCPHLVAAFKTWFRRAGRAPQGGEN